MKTNFQKLVTHFRANGEKKVGTYSGSTTSYFLKDSRGNTIELADSQQEHGPQYFFGPNDWLPNTEYLTKEFLLDTHNKPK